MEKIKVQIERVKKEAKDNGKDNGLSKEKKGGIPAPNKDAKN